MNGDIIRIESFEFKKFISRNDIDHIIKKMVEEVSSHYKSNDVIEMIAILDGSYHFASDFTRAYPTDTKIHFIKSSSYIGFESSGTIALQGLDNLDLENKHILILEDIVETGNTLTEIINRIKEKNPSSVKIASLLLKPDALQNNLTVDFIGKKIGAEFVVGYGLDYNGWARSYPDIYVKI